MRCPYCGHGDDRVVDSREVRAGQVIRRRRECVGCSRRFTTYERIEHIPYMVIKRDGRREPFDRRKILGGLLKACEKRPVPVQKLEAIVDRAENRVQESENREVSTTDLGAAVAEELRDLDQVAYVRFASVYKHFENVSEFLAELKELLDQRK